MLTSANAGVPLYVDKCVQRGRVCSQKRISDKSENTVCCRELETDEIETRTEILTSFQL